MGSKASFITSKRQSQNLNQSCLVSKAALKNTLLYVTAPYYKEVRFLELLHKETLSVVQDIPENPLLVLARESKHAFSC